jgi:hypothetical protein
MVVLPTSLLFDQLGGCLKNESHAVVTHRGFERTLRILCSCEKLKKFDRDLPAFGFLFELQSDPHTQEALSADG